jgi:hypothetical protein
MPFVGRRRTATSGPRRLRRPLHFRHGARQRTLPGLPRLVTVVASDGGDPAYPGQARRAQRTRSPLLRQSAWLRQATLPLPALLAPRRSESPGRIPDRRDSSARCTRCCGERDDHREHRKTRAFHARLAFGGGHSDLQSIAPLPPHAFPSRSQHVRRFASVRWRQAFRRTHFGYLSCRRRRTSEKARCAVDPTGPCLETGDAIRQESPPATARVNVFIA